MGLPEIVHSPPYVIPMKGSWRIVVPIRGKLSPKVLKETFPTKDEAGTWLGSDAGQDAVSSARGVRSHVEARGQEPVPTSATL